MFRQSLFAVALIGSLSYCGSVQAFVQMNAPENGYTTAYTAPTTEADNSAADTGNFAKSDSVSHVSVSAALPPDDSTEPATVGDAPSIESEPAESVGAARAHINPAASAHPAKNAKPPKTHTSVRWQSLLPGVMK